jgi:hypothetical protein
MFADLDADIYVLVDGDGTYDVPSARGMIERRTLDSLDMVVGARVHHDGAAYRRGHRIGNRLLTWFVSIVFGRTISDMLSGYRVFTRRFVKSFPVLTRGFEIETELTVHGLELSMPLAEIATPYYARPEGSTSKLKTWQDGIRILWTIVRLYKSERPLAFFAAVGCALATIAILLAIPIFGTYLREGLVPRFPTAILATGRFPFTDVRIGLGHCDKGTPRDEDDRLSQPTAFKKIHQAERSAPQPRCKEYDWI